MSVSTQGSKGTINEPDHPDIQFTRLPSNAAPYNYLIKIKPDLENFTFSGTVQIKVKVKVRSHNIVLNSSELNIKSVKWQKDGCGGCCQPDTQTVDYEITEETELLTMVFDPPLRTCKGTLTLKYTGVINDDLIGFYRSKYTTANGEEKYNAVTQFESTHARNCFPCFDEPALKATFDIHLIVPNDIIALSNMPLFETRKSKHDERCKICIFKRTPVMSTYLVAFVLLGENDYDFLEARSIDNKVICRVYATKEKKESGRFALNVCTRVLPFYKDYFGIPYTLPKMDLVSIEDFAAGGMENWGLVFFRESALIVSEENTSAIAKQNVALVVGHEVAHQWFGNLVTMEWWDGLFLKEGYASFVEFMCVQYLYPEFDIWTQFVTQTLIPALDMDSLNTSHPIEIPVENPAEIEEIFDDISYCKGAAIIRMLHRYIGDGDFRKGMKLYLSKFKYKNTKVEDLWAALEKASSKPIAAVMSTWTKQMGFPIIKIISSKQDGNNRILELTQEKFWSNPILREDLELTKSYKWNIPLTFSTSEDPQCIIKETLMTDFKCTVTIPHVANTNVWIKLNPGFVGFYRARYTTEMLKQFTTAIKDKALPALDRLSLLDDLFATVLSGECNILDVLYLLEAFENEDSYTVWFSVNNIITYLSNFACYTDYAEEFRMFSQNLFTKIYKKIGWVELGLKDNHLENLLRSLVLTRMASVGHQPTIDESLIRFAAHISGEKLICPDLRTPLYKAVLRVGDQQVYESILRKYRETDSQEEKNSIGKSLGAFLNPDILTQVLEFSISEDVRRQDSDPIVSSVAKMSKVGRDLAWTFFMKNYKIFRDRCSSGNSVGTLIKAITEYSFTDEKADEVEKFFHEHLFLGAERAIEQTVENIRLHAAWLARDRHLLQEFFTSNTR